MTAVIIGVFVAIIIIYCILYVLIRSVDDMQTVQEMYLDYIVQKRKEKE